TLDRACRAGHADACAELAALLEHCRGLARRTCHAALAPTRNACTPCLRGGRHGQGLQVGTGGPHLEEHEGQHQVGAAPPFGPLEGESSPRTPMARRRYASCLRRGRRQSSVTRISGPWKALIAVFVCSFAVLLYAGQRVY